MRAVSALREHGVSIRHLHVSTLKPFNDPAIVEAAAQSRFGVITMENHTIIGGLGSAVAERMAEAGVGKRLIRVGLQDTYAHGGSRPYLMRTYGLDAIALVGAIEKLLDQQFGITERDLVEVRVQNLQGFSTPEAL